MIQEQKVGPIEQKDQKIIKMGVVSGFQLGREICATLGVSTEEVSSININIPADGAVEVVITRYVGSKEVDKLIEVISKYELHTKK